MGLGEEVTRGGGEGGVERETKVQTNYWPPSVCVGGGGGCGGGGGGGGETVRGQG